MPTTDYLAPETNLAALLVRRAQCSPQAPAYTQFVAASKTWDTLSWAEAAQIAARWQVGLRQEGLSPGDRVAVMLKNCREWVYFDQAALGLGLVVVPIYVGDRADNVAYILEHTEAQVLLVDSFKDWQALAKLGLSLPTLRRVLLLHPPSQPVDDARVQAVAEWLPDAGSTAFQAVELAPNTLATIVYTSGTTGKPKGVMLSHQNILSNAASGLQAFEIYPEDRFLSFLPLSHMFERTVGYYLALMAGAEVVYARSAAQLPDDLKTRQPTVIISVPRVFERFYTKLHDTLARQSAWRRTLFTWGLFLGWQAFLAKQGRGHWGTALLAALGRPLVHRLRQPLLTQLGGRLRLAVCGGAALAPEIAKTFLSLGVPLGQGYGMTESGPVVSVFRAQRHVPASVGIPLPGVEVRIGAQDELLVRGPSVMQGYWRNPEATAVTLDAEGFLHTGDQAKQVAGQLYITGRIKEIIVMANGEKVPPVDMEMAILLNPLFDQVLVLGEAKPYLAALVVINTQQAQALKLNPDNLDAAAHQQVMQLLNQQLRDFPGYAKVRKLAVLSESWTVENGLLTSTLKPRRKFILERYATEVVQLYAGHSDRA